MNYSKQRELILAIVKNTKVHPTAEWVYQEAKKEMPSIGIATVYRNLNALAERGEFKRITVAGRTFAVQDESTSLSTVLFKGLCDNCREQKHDIN